MNSLAQDFGTGLFTNATPPCLSLYQPTHRRHPDNQQDPIRFGNLVRELEQSLKQKHPKRDVRALLHPFHALGDNRDFWNHALDGLAILAGEGLFRVYRLQRTVPELSIVADSFHIKPLIRILQSADRYQILGLNRQGIQLYEGNRDTLDPVELPPNLLQSMADVLKPTENEPQVMARPHTTGANRGGRHYGHGSKADSMDADTERFFRTVDRIILEHYSRPTGLPLLLAALPEHHALFHRISNNPYLLKDSLQTHPDALSIEALRQHAWEVIRPQYLERLAGLVELFGAGQDRNLSDGDPANIARNVVAGRVGTLLVEAERIIPGHLDPVTGAIELTDLKDPQVDDLLDDLAQLTLQNRGQVIVVPAERMPVKSGVAAIYRF